MRWLHYLARKFCLLEFVKQVRHFTNETNRYALRKSGNFTGLDFAPPKKFKDPDSMSDAGSIRSNRSGLSRANESAIRNGAGRVSRLPGDIIFSQAQMESSLKPTFNMHNNY